MALFVKKNSLRNTFLLDKNQEILLRNRSFFRKWCRNLTKTLLDYARRSFPTVVFKPL